MVLAFVAVIAGSTGCRRSPFQRLTDEAAPGPEPTSERSDVPRLLPVTADGVLPANALGSQTWQGAGTADPSVRQANAEASAPLPPKPTPLLDAALKLRDGRGAAKAPCHPRRDKRSSRRRGFSEPAQKVRQAETGGSIANCRATKGCLPGSEASG